MLIAHPLRLQLVDYLNEAIAAGAKQSRACQLIGLSSRTYQRWIKPKSVPEDGRLLRHFSPKNKLSHEEREVIIDTVNSDEFKDMSPNQIVPILADRHQYIASESTFYRVMRAENLNAHRQKSRVSSERKRPDALVAQSPNQIYTWDITYLATTVKGVFYYLYLFLDVFSRKIVGWQVYEEQSAAYAADVIRDISARENVVKDQVTVHSDNGSPMKGATMLTMLQTLGIATSFSRPSVSNDNPYSESLFRTLKYRPNYPNTPFESLLVAREWVTEFVYWYNHQHRHSCIQFVTPAQRHSGEDREILMQRKVTYEKAKAANKQRWSGDIRNWEWYEEVHLNPTKSNSDPLPT